MMGHKKKYVGGGEKIKICVGGVDDFFHSATLRISNGIALSHHYGGTTKSHSIITMTILAGYGVQI